MILFILYLSSPLRGEFIFGPDARSGTTKALQRIDTIREGNGKSNRNLSIWNLLSPHDTNISAMLGVIDEP
jgi:hypothetical protein